MGAKADFPTTFEVTDPAVLKRDLDRLGQGLYKYAQDAALAFQPVPDPSPPQVLAFGATTRVAIPADTTLNLQLPQPDVKNGRRSLFIKRETTTGTVNVRAVGGSLINGHTSQLLPAQPGLYAIMFDSQNYYSQPALAADWGG